MTPDKLPEEIQEQIKAEAEAHKKKPHYRGGVPLSVSPQLYLKLGYEAGATSWAPWFVKHNAIESELHGVRAENERLKKSNQQLQAQAQHMADTLEWIKTYGPCDDLTVKFIKKALQQFKDGKEGIKNEVCTCDNIQLAAHGECWASPGRLTKDGKGRDEPEEIEYMPIHPDDARKFDCPTQFPMHLLSESQAQSNHGQTLKRLKERGGLSVREILAIVNGKSWSYYHTLQWKEAIGMLNDIIITNPTK